MDRESQYLADSLRINAWTKADFDGNGYTVIVAVGNWDGYRYIICILDSGKSKFFVNPLTTIFNQDCTVPFVSVIDKTPVIIYGSVIDPYGKLIIAK